VVSISRTAAVSDLTF